MALINLDYIKKNFEQWEPYCTIEGGDLSPSEILQLKLDRAEEEFLEYLDVTQETITPGQLRFLLIIVKKNCFDIKHGDTEFEFKPQIIKDYEEAVKFLDKKRVRQGAIDKAESIKINAKEREFDEWFNEPITTADESA
jgi:hypothetical protein